MMSHGPPPHSFSQQLNLWPLGRRIVFLSLSIFILLASFASLILVRTGAPYFGSSAPVSTRALKI